MCHKNSEGWTAGWLSQLYAWIGQAALRISGKKVLKTDRVLRWLAQTMGGQSCRLKLYPMRHMVRLRVITWLGWRWLKATSDMTFVFQASSQNCKKPLSASSRLTVRPSVRMEKLTSRWTYIHFFIFQCFWKIYRESLNFTKIWYE